MKLYKGDKIMQMVDKDQVDTCLAAGWCKNAPEAEEEEARKAQELKEAEELAVKEAEEAKEAQLLADKELMEAEDAKKALEVKKATSTPKKRIIKTSKNK